METLTKTTHLSDPIVAEILARLPLRSISRLKLLSKTWKSTLESPYFRRLFLSLQKSSLSSSSWSLYTSCGSKEIMCFFGCKTWDLQKSLGLCIPRFYPNGHYQHIVFSNGLVLIKDRFKEDYFVGNPVLQQWVKIPPLLVYFSGFCLMTRVDDNGVVSSFKVVRFAKLPETFSVSLYSSETGVWTSKEIHCPFQINSFSYMTMNGTIYFYYISIPGVFIAHDFYSESDHFRAIQYLDYPSENNPEFRRALTTSRGFVVYVRTLDLKEESVLKVWRLNNDDSWQLLWNRSLSIIGNYVPMAMHPFDSGIVYLWCLQNRHLVLCNLRARSNRILINGYTYNDDDNEGCVVDYSVCDKRMHEKWCSRLPDWRYGPFEVLFQFLLPRWMESMPCPPEVEMINTTSLLSEVTSIQETRMSNRGYHGYL